MAALWATIKGRPTDAATITRVIGALEGCGAVEACVAHAAALVGESFRRADPLLPDSLAKLQLEAFGAYLVELPK